MRLFDDEFADWRRPAGYFVLAPIAGPAATLVRELQQLLGDPAATGN